MRCKRLIGEAKSKLPGIAKMGAGRSLKSATTARACRASSDRKFSSHTSPPIKRGLDSALLWCNKSCLLMAGKSHASPTNHAARSSASRTPNSPQPDSPSVTANAASGKRPTLLIVDDDAPQRSLLDSFLKSQNFETITVDSGEKALQALATKPVDMMISDVRMPGISGLETLRRARQQHGSLPVLLVTGYADVRDAVGAMRDGAVNYLSKPIDLDELLASVQRATGMAAQKRDVELFEDKKLSESIVAESPTMKALFRDAALIAGSDSRLLITGESGAGKEVLADLIHSWSPRVEGPMVKVNCAAIPETLLESELFGHERGAFTGATQTRIGRFEQANE